MIKRIVLAAAALSVTATAAAAAVVAVVLALYALLKPLLGEPGAAAAVAAIAALISLVAGLILAGQARGGGSRRRPPPEPTLGERMGELLRERPIMAAVGALAAGLIALRNPQAAAGMMSAFFAGKASEKDGRRRR